MDSILSYSTMAISSSLIYQHFSYLISTLSSYFQRFMPIIPFDGQTIEIDEMFLGAKKKGSHGRNPAPSCLVFGILFWLLIEKQKIKA